MPRLESRREQQILNATLRQFKYLAVLLGLAMSLTARGQGQAPQDPPALSIPPFGGLGAPTGEGNSLAQKPGAFGNAATAPAAYGPPPAGSLPDLPAAAPDQPPSGGGSALTENAPAVTNSQIGVARHFLYHFRVGTRIVFDDNIFLSPNQKESDEFLVLNGGLTVGLGDPLGTSDYLQFDYSPDASFYREHDGENAFQNSFSLAGLYQFTKLTVTGRFGIQLLNGTDLSSTTAAGAQSTQANLDVNGRSKLNVYSGQVDFNYSFSEKSSADLSAQYSISDYAKLLSSENLSGSFFFNYVFSPKLTFGVGTTVGETLSERPNPNQTYYQANLRTSYEATGKISIAGTAGAEFRTSDESDQVEIGPVFNINAVYLPFDGSSVSFEAGRQTTPSAVLGGQNYETTNVSVSFRQRFLQRYFVSLTTGYQNLHYVSDVANVTATRDDNYFYVQGGIELTIHENYNVSLSLLHRNSDSTSRAAGFNDNQVSLGLTVSF